MMNDTSMHREAWDRIPWIVNGSLPQSERLAVEAHLETCADCREELEFQRRLAVSMARCNSPDIDPQVSWQRLRQRIGASGSATPSAAATPPAAAAPPAALERHPRLPGIRGSGRWIPWLVAAMVVQAIGLGALGTVLWSRPNAAAASAAAVYRTLAASEPTSSPATIRTVFAPDMTLAKMQALLGAAGLQVRSGPSSAGVWSLEPVREANRSSTQSALKQLRDNPGVRFAEAIGGLP
jgi:anti-sigma factor RsiW